jgi:glutamine amidotransferase
MIAIIDYGMGNVASMQKALRFLKLESQITRDFSIIDKSNAIILPGVGSFEQGIKNLRKFDLVDILTEQVLFKKKKFLGVCLGMQLVMDKGFEPNECNGLGWIKGEVVKMNPLNLSIPHLGWNNLDIIKNNELFSGVNSLDYYFIHSYKVLPEDKSVVVATTEYGGEVTASMLLNNIFTTQFHPEKSQDSGLKLLKNYFG